MCMCVYACWDVCMCVCVRVGLLVCYVAVENERTNGWEGVMVCDGVDGDEHLAILHKNVKRENKQTNKKLR